MICAQSVRLMLPMLGIGSGNTEGLSGRYLICLHIAHREVR